MHYPTPCDLQLVILEKGQDLPSCVPAGLGSKVIDSVKITDRKPQKTLAVFVNTSVQIEASVTIGNNLTFTFAIEDVEEVKVIQPCYDCLTAVQVRT